MAKNNGLLEQQRIKEESHTETKPRRTTTRRRRMRESREYRKQARERERENLVCSWRVVYIFWTTFMHWSNNRSASSAFAPAPNTSTCQDTCHVVEVRTCFIRNKHQLSFPLAFCVRVHHDRLLTKLSKFSKHFEHGDACFYHWFTWRTDLLKMYKRYGQLKSSVSIQKLLVTSRPPEPRERLKHSNVVSSRTTCTKTSLDWKVTAADHHDLMTCATDTRRNLFCCYFFIF